MASFTLRAPEPLQEKCEVIAFEVNDMSCGHCVQAITAAVKAADSLAEVHIDLARHRVEIESPAADAAALAGAIREAGFTPQPV